MPMWCRCTGVELDEFWYPVDLNVQGEFPEGQRDNSEGQSG
jgi:hypothetical protein